MQSAHIPEHVFRWPLRVYYEDTDAAGVVYHANYLKYCERARTEWLRSLGLDQRNLRAEQGLVFVVSRLTADYLRGAELDDALEVRSCVAQLGQARIVFEQSVWRGDERMFVSNVTIACVDWAARRAVRLPENVRALLETIA
jgi:acyl-CoA thioester hydrolase